MQLNTKTAIHTGTYVRLDAENCRTSFFDSTLVINLKYFWIGPCTVYSSVARNFKRGKAINYTYQ